jgi:hypothetical protein
MIDALAAPADVSFNIAAQSRKDIIECYAKNQTTDNNNIQPQTPLAFLLFPSCPNNFVHARVPYSRLNARQLFKYRVT